MKSWRWTRPAAVATAVIGLVLGGSAPAYADASGGGANHVVQTSATADLPTVERGSVQVAPFSGDTLDSANLAIAKSTDCTGCRSIAVAFQGILLGSSPSTFDPGNVATAANAGCTSCVSFAFAYQDIVSTPGPAYLTQSGRAAVADVTNQVAAVAASNDDPVTMCNELSQLAAAFAAALTDSGNVASAGHPVEVQATFSAPDCPG